MNNNDILGTQNWKENQADPFLAQKIAIFGKYLYVDNVDEIFIRIRICTWTTYSPYVRMADPSLNEHRMCVIQQKC